MERRAGGESGGFWQGGSGWHFGSRGNHIWRCWKCPTLPISLDPQFFYHNFDRSNYDDDDIRTCTVLDLSSLRWVPMQCEAQLDWICKLPKGTQRRGPQAPIEAAGITWRRMGCGLGERVQGDPQSPPC